MRHEAPASPVEEKFKILRAVDPSVIGGTKPLGISKEIHFPNAQGGLRMVDSAEIRMLAKHSAESLVMALSKA